jgi:hypothetical protein
MVIPPGGTGKPFTLVWNYTPGIVPGQWWIQNSTDMIHWSNMMPVDGHTTMLIVTNNKPCEYFRFVTE